MDCQLPPFTVHKCLSVLALGDDLPYNIVDYGIDKLWLQYGAGEGVTIGVADTGYPSSHIGPGGDLEGVFLGAKDFTGEGDNNDTHGHSTHVCGTIFASPNNGRGIGGGAWKAKGYTARCLGRNGNGSDKSVADSIRYLADMGCDLINCSLGSAEPSQLIKAACSYAISKESLPIVAAGNEGPNTVGFPAQFDAFTLAVGAIDRSRRLAGFSSTGPSVDIVGPGVQIRSCYLNGQYAELSGTSMATPWITAVVAIRLGYERKMSQGKPVTLERIKQLLRETVDDLGKLGADPQFGMGVPRVGEFVSRGVVILPPIVVPPVPPIIPVPDPVVPPPQVITIPRGVEVPVTIAGHHGRLILD